MVYIPSDWLKNQKNESKVREIINRHLASDVNPRTDRAIEELEALGETTILERLKDGSLGLN